MKRIENAQTRFLDYLERLEFTLVDDKEWQTILALSMVLFDAEHNTQRVNAALTSLFDSAFYLDGGVYVRISQTFLGAGVGQSRNENSDVVHEWRFHIKGVTGAIVLRRLSMCSASWKYAPKITEYNVLEKLEEIGCPFESYKGLKKCVVNHQLNHPGATIDSQHQLLLENRFRLCPLRYENWRLIHQNQADCGRELSKPRTRSDQCGKKLADASPKTRDELQEKKELRELKSCHLSAHDGVVIACDFMLSKPYQALATLERDRSRLKELLHPDFAKLSALDTNHLEAAFSGMASRLRSAKIADANNMLRLCIKATNSYLNINLDLPVGNTAQQNVAKAAMLSARQWSALCLDVSTAFLTEEAKWRARVCIILMRYTGLRPEELWCLRISSIHNYRTSGIKVREGLKSNQARRALPIELIPSGERDCVTQYFEYCLSKHTTKDFYLFHASERAQWTEHVSTGMRKLTGNEYADSYSLRHCALTRLGAVLFNKEACVADVIQLDEEALRELRTCLVGDNKINAFNAQPVFERIAGHLEPGVGFEHYNHVLDVLLDESVLNTQPGYSLKKLSGMSAVSEGKYLSGAIKKAENDPRYSVEQHALTQALKRYYPNLNRGGRSAQPRSQPPHKVMPTLMILYKNRDSIESLGALFGSAFQKNVESRSKQLTTGGNGQTGFASALSQPLKHNADIEFFQYVSDHIIRQNIHLIVRLVSGRLVSQTVSQANQAYSDLKQWNHATHNIRFRLKKSPTGRPQTYWSKFIESKGVVATYNEKDLYVAVAVIAKKRGEAWREARQVSKHIGYYGLLLSGALGAPV